MGLKDSLLCHAMTMTLPWQYINLHTKSKESSGKTVAFKRSMLDVRNLMLDIQECSRNEIQKHPESGNQYQNSVLIQFQIY